MKSSLASLLTPLMLLTLSSCNKPDWSGAKASKIELRNGPRGQTVVAVLTEVNKIEFVLRCFRRSSKIHATDDDRRRLINSYRIDVIGNNPVAGPWLYEFKSGMFCMLFDFQNKPVFKMLENDRTVLNLMYSDRLKPESCEVNKDSDSPPIFYTADQMTERLVKVAALMNTLAPKMIGDETRLDSAVAGSGNAIQFNYTLVNAIAKEHRPK